MGRSLARAWRGKGYRIGAVITRSLRTAQAAVKFIEAGKASAGITEDILSADVVLIATPDGQIAQAAKGLAGLQGSWRGKIVLHSSGTLSSKELMPLKERGASVGSLHPIYPFPQAVRQFPNAIVFGLEGGLQAARVATALVRALGCVPVKVRAEDKALYHAAAVMTAGHLMTLMDLGARMLVRAGVPRQRARGALLPLIEQTIEGYSRKGERAWTGPLERGDEETVRRHMQALRRLPASYQDAYLSLARASLELYRADNATTQALKKLLKEGKG